MTTVGDSVARELNFFYETILECISDNTISKLSWACCDNKVNQDAAYCCKFCRRKGQGGDTNADKLDHIIASASFYGLWISTGSLVGSQLSTTCPRLQKHGESLASLSFGSYLDVIHSIINPEAMDLIEKQQTTLEGPVSKEERFKTKHRKISDEEDEYIEDFHPCVGEMLIEETTPKEEKGRHPLSIPFDTNNHIDVLSHLSLSGGSLHTHTMKYKSDSNLKNSDIPLVSSRIECKCAETAREMFRKK